MQALMHRPDELHDGAVRLSLEFVRRKSPSHPKHPERCKSPRRRALAQAPIIVPDLLKLARVVEDSLTGIFWKDDSQVIEQTFSKKWGERDLVNVEVEYLF
jgi:Holliday junction resolvase RusA-like endonuclease